jgi:hypothetical protein
MKQSDEMAATIEYSKAVALGFPVRPSPGQMIRTSDGRIWVWPHEAGKGLHDLGQWVEAIGAGVSFISKLFGGGGPKPDNQARATLQQQQLQMQHLQEQVDAQSFFNQKTVFLLAVVGLAVVMAFKK